MDCSYIFHDDVCKCSRAEDVEYGIMALGNFILAERIDCFFISLGLEED